MQYKVFIVSALAGLSAALTQPDTTKFPAPVGNPITSPLNQIVPAGKPFTIQWTPTTQGKVSLLLLKGPSSNAVPIATLADSIDNTGTFVWTPDTSLAPTTDAQGYGIELVVEGTGQYQYSTQIGIGKADGASDSSNSASAYASAASSSYAPAETAPPAGTTQGTAVGGALNETVTVTTSCSESTAAAAVTAATGSANVSSPIVQATGSLTVPSSLSTVAQPGSTGSANSGSGAGASASSSSKSTAISTGAAAVAGVQLTGTVAAIAGLLSYFAL